MQGKYFNINEPKYDYPNIFLVEGQDDALLLEILLHELEVSENDARVIVCQGKSGFEKHIPLITKSPAYFKKIKTISIVRDADNDSVKAEQEVTKVLQKESLPIPKVGSLAEKDGKRVGIYFFPRTGSNGDLETLALEIAEESDALTASVSLIDTIIASGSALNKPSKRKIQVYLAASSKEVRQTVGWAFKDGTIPINLTNMAEFVSFVRNVLEGGSK